MQWVLRGFAVVMAKLMGTSGAESLNVAASLFLGQTEAPLTIRPYLARLTRSELLTVMTSGMAHVSGGVMAAYISYGIEARHILTAVIMTAPGAILLSKILVPETGTPETLGTVGKAEGTADANVLDAAARGTRDGLHLALNIAAMLISFLALVELVNLGLGYVGTSLQDIVGWVMAPVAYMLGVAWEDCKAVGKLLGTRTVLNELIAFSDLGSLRDKGILIDRSVVIASFALCGFANIGSIGIQFGGIGALAPERRHDLARLGCEPSSPERWPITFQPASRESCYDGQRLFLDHSARPPLTGPRGGRGASIVPRAMPRAVAIVLGSGLNELAARVEAAQVIPYARGSPLSRRRRWPGMRGRSSAANSPGRIVIVFQGRFHYYEGHDLDTVTFPVRVVQAARGEGADPDRSHRRHRRRPAAR